jgi:hypothetical protein
MPTGHDQVHYTAAHSDNRTRLWDTFDSYAQQRAAAAHREHAGLVAAAQAASTDLDHTYRERVDLGRRHTDQLRPYGSLGHATNPATLLARAESDAVTARTSLTKAQQDISRFSAEPAIRALPAGQLAGEHDLWRAGYDTQREFERQEARLNAMRVDLAPHSRLDTNLFHQRQVGLDRDGGPSIGR